MIKKKEPAFRSWTSLLSVIALLTGLHWAILAFQIPIFDNLPYWKYKLHITPVSPIWMAAAFALLGTTWVLIHSRMKLAWKLIMLILLGTAIQYSFAFSKGYGLNGIRDRMVTMGHAEFAKASVEQPGDVLWVLQNYEEIAAKVKYGYIGSKPPGTFLFYLLFEQVSHAMFPATDHVERLENLRTFASWTWPLISYLVVIPLYFLTRELFKDPHAALWTCVLYLTVPSVTLITLHTDQVIYPLMAVGIILLGINAYRRDDFWLAVLCGAALYFAVYFSFGLAAVGIFLLLPVVFSYLNNENFTIGRLARYSAAIILGAALLHGLAVIFLDYDIVTRYENAWVNHLGWKGWENNLETFLKAGFTNLVEFSVWIGLPITLLFLAGCYDLYNSRQFRPVTSLSVLNMLLAGVFLFLLIFGKTKAETARLWLFLVPFLCISVAGFIQQRDWSKQGRSIISIGIILLNMVTTYFIVHFQDFS